MVETALHAQVSRRVEQRVLAKAGVMTVRYSDWLFMHRIAYFIHLVFVSVILGLNGTGLCSCEFGYLPPACAPPGNTSSSTMLCSALHPTFAFVLALNSLVQTVQLSNSERLPGRFSERCWQSLP